MCLGVPNLSRGMKMSATMELDGYEAMELRVGYVFSGEVAHEMW